PGRRVPRDQRDTVIPALGTRAGVPGARSTRALRPVAHDRPDRNGEEQRRAAYRDEYRAPGNVVDDPGERSSGGERAGQTQRAPHAGDGGEAALVKPLRVELEHRDERYRYTETDQHSSGHRRGGRLRGAEAYRPDAGNQTAERQYAAWAEGVAQDARRDLRYRVYDVVGRGERTQHRAADSERGLQLRRDRRRRHAV